MTYSPYATADPRLRHAFSGLRGLPPLPGTLLPAGCGDLAVVPDEVHLIRHGSPPADEPGPWCTGCLDAIRGHIRPDVRPVARCRECGLDTRHGGWCAVCRQGAHHTWLEQGGGR